ncbi:hypothetical protein IT414_03940 [bacterium]|nr:hypothetical protein [bacterium]
MQSMNNSSARDEKQVAVSRISTDRHMMAIKNLDPTDLRKKQPKKFGKTFFLRPKGIK